MSLLIEREEALALLRKNVKHYLWNRPMNRWTAADVYNLRNGININHGNILRENAPKKKPYEVKEMTVKKDNPGLRGTRTGREVLVTTESGQKLQFLSVVKASQATGVPAPNIYNLLNGRYAQSFGYTFKKLNQ